MSIQVTGEDREQENIDRHDHVHEEDDEIQPEDDQCRWNTWNKNNSILRQVEYYIIHDNV